MCIADHGENRGPEAATLHVLPTLWFRNTWSWGLPGSRRRADDPRLRTTAASAEHRLLGRLVLAGDGEPEAAGLRQRVQRASGCGAPPSRSPYPKDGINDHVVRRRCRRSTRTGVGTKAALHYVLDGAGRRAARDPAAARPGRRWSPAAARPRRAGPGRRLRRR